MSSELCAGLFQRSVALHILLCLSEEEASGGNVRSGRMLGCILSSLVGFWLGIGQLGCHSCRMSGWSAVLALVARSSVVNSSYPTVGLAAVASDGRNGVFVWWGASFWLVFRKFYIIPLLCWAPGWDGGGRLYLQRCLQSRVLGCLSGRLLSLSFCVRRWPAGAAVC